MIYLFGPRPWFAQVGRTVGGLCRKTTSHIKPITVVYDWLDVKVRPGNGFESVTPCQRTPAYPYEAPVPGPPNFGGLGPEGPIPFTEFRASGADMYGTLTHRISPFLVQV